MKRVLNVMMNNPNNLFSIKEDNILLGCYKVYNYEDEPVGNLLSSKQEALLVCDWLNSLIFITELNQ